ncbi:hypothetical protein FRAHR75_760010 [Frankia sp. Hr75.2]|nr:hypothetical protein FRAHR75_760010 [Frankia sp. Hr75.2]
MAITARRPLARSEQNTTCSCSAPASNTDETPVDVPTTADMTEPPSGRLREPTAREPCARRAPAGRCGETLRARPARLLSCGPPPSGRP